MQQSPGPLDYIAIIGYSLILFVTLYHLPESLHAPNDIASVSLMVIGLCALITYHIRRITEQVDETDADSQKYIRAIAHSSIAASRIIAVSAGTYQWFDGFAVVAHIILLVTVLNGMTQLAGLGLLAIYFLFATYYQAMNGPYDIDTLLLVGRALMLIFFLTAFIIGILLPPKTTEDAKAEKDVDEVEVPEADS